MSLRICVYEDTEVKRFYPITHLRPVYLMRAGILPLYRQVEKYLGKHPVSLAARDVLSPAVARSCRDYPVNMIKRETGEDILFVNGRIRNFGDLAEQLKGCRLSTRFKNGDQTIAVLFKAEAIGDLPALATPQDFVQVAAEATSDEDFVQYDSKAILYQHCWELVDDLGAAIESDYDYLSANFPHPDKLDIHQGTQLINPDRIFFGSGVKTFPATVLDATAGPIYIGANTVIESQVTITGPCYIGPNSLVTAGKITHSSIGHTCRVGGEVEESIFQSYVNKYHAGFIGHSYVGSWVNFGAMTTNSDLKNNYSSIRVMLNGETINTGSIKVGSFIGDHTKFGIGTLLNTGINIGVCCNIFGGSLVTDKEIPSFSWGTTGAYSSYQLDKAIDTACRTAERRHVSLADNDLEPIRAIAENRVSLDGCLDL